MRSAAAGAARPSAAGGRMTTGDGVRLSATTSSSSRGVTTRVNILLGQRAFNNDQLELDPLAAAAQREGRGRRMRPRTRRRWEQGAPVLVLYYNNPKTYFTRARISGRSVVIDYTFGAEAAKWKHPLVLLTSVDAKLASTVSPESRM
jgi:hypothetical protein